MHRRLIALILVSLAWGAAHAELDCRRVVAVGDLHGGYDAFSAILAATELVGDDDEWLDRRSCLVQTGDIVDRGARSRELLDRIMRLQERNPDQVHVLLGNHEVMVMLGQTRDSARGEFAAFAADESKSMRRKGYELFRRSPAAAELTHHAARAAFLKKYPPGWFARRAAFAPKGQYGAWLLKRPLLLRIDDSLFVHGGIERRDAELGIAALNKQLVKAVRDYHRLRRDLERRDEMTTLTPFVESFALARATAVRLSDETLLVRDPGALRAARGLGELESAIFSDPAGPLWTRRLAREDESVYMGELEQILTLLGVERIVVGHTVMSDHRINSRFAGKALLIDTGAGPHYGSHPAALEISRAGQLSAIYLDGRQLLGQDPALAAAAGEDYRLPAGMGDAELEKFLREAEIVGAKEIGVGVTKPRRLVLQQGGLRLRAAFKSVNQSKLGTTEFRGGSAEFNFTDRHVYERAAYLLDRELEMNRVPVAVLREFDGEEGVVVQWIEDAIDEGGRLKERSGPENGLYLQYQKHIMYLFDALILNTDRTPANQLITPADWRLHLIDHSRAFRMTRKLPELIEKMGLTLPRAQYEALKRLNEKRLVPLLDGLLSRGQVRALLARRDRLVRKLDRDIAEKGAERVFQEEIPQSQSAELAPAPE